MDAKNKLFPFQEMSMPILQKRRHTLLADECGLGKTVQAIELINRQMYTEVLIICKASIKENWNRKIADWGMWDLTTQIINKKTDIIGPQNIIIVNYDLITHSYIHCQLCQRQWDLLICDEAHYLKNMKAKRTHAVLSKQGLVRHANHTLMMTGTPILNRPIELYPILKVLSPETIAPYNDYYRYAKRFCNGHQDGFSFNDKGASHTDDLNKRLRAGYMIRRSYDEVEKELPKKRHEIIFIDQTPDAKTNLRTLENATRTDFKHQKLGIGAGQLETLRKDVAMQKLDACMDKIKEYVDSVDKLVIFAYHHDVIDKLNRDLQEYGPICLTGTTPTTLRQTIIDKFIKYSDIKVFIGQIQAAGEGIDGLQKVCHNMLFVESSWVPGEIAQAIARLWRLEQSHSVLIRFLVWADSIEEHMIRVALDKVKVIKEITK